MDKNIERERILLIEEATLRIKAAVTNSVMNKVHKVLVKDQCESIIKSTERKLKELKLDEELIKITLNALRSNYRIWYSQILDQLEKAEKNDTTGLVSDTLKAMKNLNYKPSKGGFTIATSNNTVGMEQIKVTNLREMMTIYDEGAAGRYVDYVGEIKKTLVNIQNEISNGTLSAIDSLGRKKSIRNMAEIKTRYDLINEDLNKLKEKGVEYVIATAHGNASERCSWWQGKIFKLDLDIETRKMGQYKGKPTQNKLGTIDGKPYYSLKEACENGFLSYNCQHRVVAYYKGVHVPKYNLVEVKKRRDITQKQRYLENKIRKAKSRQVLAISPEERKEAIEESKRLQADYRKFCEDNNVPRYDWRCRVTEVERDVSPVFKTDYMASNSNYSWETPPIKHSPEKLKEIKREVIETGFNISSSIKEFDGDIEVLSGMLSGAKKVFELFPGIKGKINLNIRPNNYESDELAETYGKSITLNSVCTRNLDELENYLKTTDIFCEETNPNTVLIHELGHAIANYYQISPLKIVYNIMGEVDSKKVMNFVKSNISEYASWDEKGNEIISECLVKYVEGSKNKFVLQFMEECNKIIVGR